MFCPVNWHPAGSWADRLRVTRSELPTESLNGDPIGWGTLPWHRRGLDGPLYCSGDEAGAVERTTADRARVLLEINNAIVSHLDLVKVLRAFRRIDGILLFRRNTNGGPANLHPLQCLRAELGVHRAADSRNNPRYCLHICLRSMKVDYASTQDVALADQSIGDKYFSPALQAV